CAVTCTYATVVSHVVQTFRRVNSSQYRANSFARRMVAVLAKHRLVNNPYIVQIFQLRNFVLTGYTAVTVIVKAIVAINTDPVHFAAAANFFLTYYRNVVLSA